jgi:glycosyltransferase involved in cell wall biosynthesis
MPEQLLVSIITVCKNSGTTIPDTIESVLYQGYPNIEYIIIDGISTDDTLAIIDSYTEKFAAKNIRYKFVSEKDKNLYDAMNKGIRMSSGDVVGIINADDWYEPNAIEIVVDAFSDKNCDIVYGQMRLFKENKEYDITGRSHEFLHEAMINHPTCFIKKHIYDVKMYDTDYRIAADYDLLLYCKSINAVFYRVPSILANFRVGGLTTIAYSKAEQEVLFIYRKYGIISDKVYLLKKSRLFLTILMRKLAEKIK